MLPPAQAPAAPGEQDTGRFYCIAGFCSTPLFAAIEFATAEAGAGPAEAPVGPRPCLGVSLSPQLGNVVLVWELGVHLPPAEHPAVVQLLCLSRILALPHF